MSIADDWDSTTKFELPRYALDRAVMRLDKIEALALIRSVFTCSVREAQELYETIKRYAVKGGI